MSGRTLLSNLMASLGISAVAAATAGSVASGASGISADDQTAGTQTLESLVEAAHEQGRMAGVTEGRKAERERFGAVLTDDAAVGRMGLAISLLSTTDLGADVVISNLAASPSAAETVAPAEPLKATGQQAQGDPLKTDDPIAADTTLVDPGKSGAVDDSEDAQVAGLWKGALATVAGGGITEGGAWGFLNANEARAN